MNYNKYENTIRFRFTFGVFRQLQLSETQSIKSHERCFSFIKEKVEKSQAKHIIVATHHVPSFLLASPDFRGSRINGAFTVELNDYIETSPIEYWIYGHSHRNIDKVIGKTQCVSNQLGYVFHNEHHSFNPGKIIEV